MYLTILYSDYQTTSEWKDKIKEKIVDTFSSLRGWQRIYSSTFTEGHCDPDSFENHEGRRYAPLAYLLFLSFSPFSSCIQ